MLETVIILVLWWLSGFLAVAWLSRGDCPTWAGLVMLVLTGWLGPLIAALCIITVLAQAEFWNTKVCDTFRRKKHDDVSDVDR